MGLKTKEIECFWRHIRGGHDLVCVEGTMSYNSVSDLYGWSNKFKEPTKGFEKCDFEPPRFFEQDELEALLECYERIKTQKIRHGSI